MIYHSASSTEITAIYIYRVCGFGETQYDNRCRDFTIGKVLGLSNCSGLPAPPES